MPVTESGDVTMVDMMQDNDIGKTDREVDHLQSLKMEIRRCLAGLNYRQKDVLCSFFGLDMPSLSLQEIGKRHNLSMERVRQIKDKALSQLRLPKKSSLLRSYLCS